MFGNVNYTVIASGSQRDGAQIIKEITFETVIEGVNFAGFVGVWAIRDNPTSYLGISMYPCRF